MNALEHFILHSSEVEARIGYEFRDKSLLALAFTHRSFVNENREITQAHNERLEFLGDSILGILAAEYLYQNFPDLSEGELSHLRSRLVEASSCASYIQKLNIEKYLLLSKGESMNDGRGRESILADLFEAILAAIYLDCDIKAAKHFIFSNFSQEIQNILEKPLKNWKAQLQDFTQKKHHQTPKYKILRETGPDHSKVFEISVHIDEREVGRGQGASKKQAQQSAAANALSKILGLDILD